MSVAVRIINCRGRVKEITRYADDPFRQSSRTGGAGFPFAMTTGLSGIGMKTHSGIGSRTMLRRRAKIAASVSPSLRRHPRAWPGDQLPGGAGRDPWARPGDDVKASAPPDSIIVQRSPSSGRCWGEWETDEPDMDPRQKIFGTEHAESHGILWDDRPCRANASARIYNGFSVYLRGSPYPSC
jgi:hypothetical protein